VNIDLAFLVFFWSPDRHFEVCVPASGNHCTCVCSVIALLLSALGKRIGR
jgi:hypothetical protein